ncbi:hypothetical protein [Parvularcula sp. IMCC14364]|uniref:hypothetical protein n=1 Tax=Parvularcula sp. IMCC14364 TaxID=3067902 RepID=UPI00274084D0|nr:hypothetical protein [Parvularcula sp. IMCC14364]
MYHVFDMYLSQEDYIYKDIPWTNRNKKTLEICRSLYAEKFAPLEDVQILKTNNLQFHPKYASNPDNMIHNWNTLAPKFSDVRENAQSVGILYGGQKL